MTQPVTIVIDGNPYFWRDLVQRRKEQLAATRRASRAVRMDFTRQTLHSSPVAHRLQFWVGKGQGRAF